MLLKGMLMWMFFFFLAYTLICIKADAVALSSYGNYKDPPLKKKKKIRCSWCNGRRGFPAHLGESSWLRLAWHIYDLILCSHSYHRQSFDRALMLSLCRMSLYWEFSSSSLLIILLLFYLILLIFGIFSSYEQAS